MVAQFKSNETDIYIGIALMTNHMQIFSIILPKKMADTLL